MGRSVLNSAFLLAVLLLWAVAGLGADQTATVREAVAVMQRGDFLRWPRRYCAPKSRSTPTTRGA